MRLQVDQNYETRVPATFQLSIFHAAGVGCEYPKVFAFVFNPSGTGLFTSHIPNSLETVVKKHKRTASLFEKKTSAREK